MVSLILVIDDELNFLRGLGISLHARDFDVELAATGEAGLRLVEDRHPDVVVLDLGLPGMDGLAVLESLRSWTDVPVIVLSARPADQAAIGALDAGADDFIGKPFSIGELVARLQAAQRRSRPQDLVLTGDLSIDFEHRQLSVANRAVHLTPTEWRLLELLVRHADRPVHSDRILSEIWGPHVVRPNDYVRVHLWSLRHKIEPVPSQPRYIVTHRGVGYRFVGHQARRTYGAA